MDLGSITDQTWAERSMHLVTGGLMGGFSFVTGFVAVKVLFPDWLLYLRNIHEFVNAGSSTPEIVVAGLALTLVTGISTQLSGTFAVLAYNHLGEGVAIRRPEYRGLLTH